MASVAQIGRVGQVESGDLGVFKGGEGLQKDASPGLHSIHITAAQARERSCYSCNATNLCLFECSHLRQL